MRAAVFALFAFVSASAVQALPDGLTIGNIDGGVHDLDAWEGRPILIVNTASLCGFTPQYRDIQTLYERFAEDGLVVLAVPSDDFSQELSSEEDVAEFCEVNYGITLPMTTITAVTGPEAHALYQWIAEQTGFEPRWNFNKVLIDREGAIVGTYPSAVRPTSMRMIRDVEAVLAD